MSLARHTSIRLSGRAGLADWGRKTRAEMIAQYREYAERQKAEAERVLAAADEDFVVETYLGSHARRNRKKVE